MLPSIELNTIYKMDATALLSSLPRKSIDLIVTDPPYGKGYRANHQVTNGGKPRRANGGFDDTFQSDWLEPAYRVLKPDSAMYLFTQWDVMHLWREAVLQAGFQFSMFFVWDKLHWGQGNLSLPGNQVELIMLCTKGTHQVRGNRQGNVWKLTKLDAINFEGNYDNDTQKPVRLLWRPIHLSSRIGDTVCDPFVGCGSTADAARRSGRNFVAGDISEYQVSIAQKRMSKDFQTPLLAI